MSRTPRSLHAGLTVALLSFGCAALDGLLNDPSDLAIQRFIATPREMAAPGPVTLAWNVEGAEVVEIDNGVGSVKAKGSIELRVERTSQYTLRARSGTSAASSSVQVRVAGGPSPAPSATPSPAPTPTPTPSPSPTPTPSPSPGASCRLPAMPECGGPEGPRGVYGCCREEREQVFSEIVERAIDKILVERPELFNGNRPKDGNAYVRGVAEILQRDFGVCAKQGGPEDEVAVKNSNGFSEQYDILLGSGPIRRHGYTVTCRPARF